MSHPVVSLRDHPEHLGTIAEWIHRQWWAGTDATVDVFEDWLQSHLGADGFPTTLIVIADGELCGSVSLHESEASDRPAYRPYLGALFVKPGCRGRGIGATLVRAVEARASELGYPAVYLNAVEPLVPFYEPLGWRVIERGYGGKQLTIMQRRLGDRPHAGRAPK